MPWMWTGMGGPVPNLEREKRTLGKYKFYAVRRGRRPGIYLE